MSRRSLIAPLVLAVGLVLPLAACGTSTTGSQPTVVASFYPLEYLVEQITGGDVRVVDLTTPGAEPHDLELKPKQVAEIADASLVVYSAGLQPAVDQTVAQNAKKSLDVSKVVDLVDDNPHFWLDPIRFGKAADAIEKDLAAALPAQADTFATNLARLHDTLNELDSAYRTGLQDCARNLVVTSHDAFGYQTRYGLRFAPIAGLTPESEPSPKHIAELRKLIESEHITTVFNETLASPKMAQTLSADLGLKTAVLDPIEGVRDGSTDDYVSLMKANLAALQQANGCPTDAKATP